MNNVRRISRQLVAFGTADVMVLAVNFLLLPIYTRVLAPREYGALALLLVCEAFLKVINRWGLDASFLRFHYDCRDEEERRTLASTVAIFWTVVNGALLIALLAAARPINRLLFGSVDLLVAYRLLIFNGFASTFLFLPFSLLRIQERARLFATLTFLRSLGTILVRLILVVGLGFGVTGLVLADVLVTLVLLAFLGRTLRSMVTWRFSAAMLRGLLGYALPRVPHGLLTQTMGMADRFLLGLYLPLPQVGLYLIGSTVASAIKFYTTSFETAWMPFAFDSMRRRDAPELFARMATYACVVLGFLALALAGLGPTLIVLMLPAAYHDAGRVVPLLVVGMAIQSLAWFLATSLNIAKRTDVYPVVTAIGAVATVAANLLLVPRLGVIGAAIALVVSQTVATGMTLYFAQRVYSIPYEVQRLLKLTAVSLAAYGAMTIVPSRDTWSTLVLRVALLGLFPLGLYLVRFVQPHEWNQAQMLVASVLDRARGGGMAVGGPGL